MHITISKSDVLQSIGFALTSAKEEYERIKGNIGAALHAALTEGKVITAEAQADATRALTAAREQMERIDALRRMAEFAKDEHGVVLDAESFALLEPNLPAR